MKKIIMIASLVLGLSFNAFSKGVEKPKIHSMKQHTVQGDISFYGPGFHGRQTARGDIYNQWGITAAHKTLPFGTKVKLTNKANGKSVIVTVTDRGPYIKGRTFDLSRGAFNKIASEKQGIIKAADITIQILSMGNGKRVRR